MVVLRGGLFLMSEVPLYPELVPEVCRVVAVPQSGGLMCV